MESQPIPGIQHDRGQTLRTLRQTDQVKLVVTDLDDTLWNGVSGEMEEHSQLMAEGWPIGVVEALMYLKKRGVLLAVISKNDPDRIGAVWNAIFRSRISLRDFASVKVNWKPKADNMREILNEVNVLPGSVVFIDDNPTERAAIHREFPEIRILGKYPYYLRTTLLWSPETQVATVTDESARRTDMIKAQIKREQGRQAATSPEQRLAFLQSLKITLRMDRIESAEHPRFARAFELINKTNQWNTTGKRWTASEMQGFFETGGNLLAFTVDTEETNYGLTGVVLLRHCVIEQFVMSCRVLGLEIDTAVLAITVSKGFASAAQRALFVKTERNLACRSAYADFGFEEREGGVWELRTAKPVPSFISVA